MYEMQESREHKRRKERIHMAGKKERRRKV